MERRQLLPIREYLQNRDVQERIQHKIAEARSKATVTISRATELFDFSENKLRDWEKRGLLGYERASRQDGRSASGHRQYTPADLDKLAVIRELLDQGYAIGELEREREEIWQALVDIQVGGDSNEVERLPIDQRVEQIYDKELFYPFFASQVLKLSLRMISEDISDTRIGLILPRLRKSALPIVERTEDLPRLGESLVGWYGRSRSFYTFLTSSPSFQYPSDFRLHPLKLMEESESREDEPNDGVLIIVPRTAKSLTPSRSAVGIIQRLIAILYEDVQNWRSYFSWGMRDIVYPAANFDSSLYVADSLLTGLADMVVHLGGRTPDNQNRWRFCCILLAKDRDTSLPLQQRSLIVRAQSKDSPHDIGITVSPDKYVNSPSLRAFQSGHVVYQPEISATTTIALREKEGPIRSALAFSVGGQSGEPIAVLYTASYQKDAFSLEDLQILRMVGRMVEEVVMMYYAGQQVTDSLGKLVEKPYVVDPLFEGFSSENDFNSDVERLLLGVKRRLLEERRQIAEGEAASQEATGQMKAEELLPSEPLSFIAIDVDNQSLLASIYGNLATRSLSWEVGLRIRDFFKDHPDRRFYHVYTDRFYVLLKGMSLEQAQEKALRLIKALEGPYRIDALRRSQEQSMRATSMLVLPDVTVRLGVASFPHMKLEDLLQRYTSGMSVIEVREIIVLELDNALEKGKNEGGNKVITWNHQIRGFEVLTSSSYTEGL